MLIAFRQGGLTARNPLCLVFLLLLAWPAHAQAGSTGVSPLATFETRVEALRREHELLVFGDEDR